MRAAVGGHQPDDHVEAGGLARAVGPEQARPPRRWPRPATRRAPRCAPCTASAAARPTTGSKEYPGAGRHAVGCTRRAAHFAAGAISPDGLSVSGAGLASPPFAGPFAVPGRLPSFGWKTPRTRSVRPASPGQRHGAGAALRLEELGGGVVRDVVAADLVVAALQDRVVEELQLLLGAVVLGALRPALVVAVGVVALLPERERIAERGRRQRVVGVLLEVDAVRRGS